MEHNNSPYLNSPNSNSNGSFPTTFNPSWAGQRQAVSPNPHYRGSGPHPMHRVGSTHSLPGSGNVQYYNSNPVSPNAFLNPGWSPQPARISYGESYDTAMSRYANQRDDPYSPFMAASGGSDRPLQETLGTTSGFAASVDIGGYRTKPPSDIASNADSGYRTRTLDTRSVMSADYAKPPSEVSLSLKQMNISEGPGRPQDVALMARSLAPPSTASRKSGASKEMKKCPECAQVFKCASDYKKHKAKHEKPFKCDVPNCQRTVGFCTTNDLDRHKKSVHNIKTRHSKDYRCASVNCKHPEKMWPRLDNFKQHLSKMHPMEDFEDLLKRSTVTSKPQLSSPIGPPSAMSIDTALAGTGAPKDYQLSSNLQDTGIIAEELSWDITIDPSNENYDDLASAYHMPKQAAIEFESQPKDFSDAYDPSLVPRGGTVPGQNVSSLSRTELTQAQESHALKALANIAASQESHTLNHSLAGLPGYTESLSGLPSSRKQAAAHYEHHGSASRFGEAANISAQNPGQKSLHTVIELLNKAMADVYPTDKLVADNAAEIKDAVMKSLEEVLTKSQAGKKAPRPAHSTKPLNGKQCAKCDKVIPRDCDMRKHMKRHTRPYGCTYPNCNKRFGSKNDWKRHENSQHFQLEMWRCQVDTRDKKQTPCAEVFYTRESFESHLKDNHKIASPETRDDYKKRFRLGRNGQSQFWCGFCQNILPLKSKGINAWDERFSHIDNEHFKKQQDIRDWLCCVANKTKREVLKLMDKGNFNDDTSEKFGSDGEGPAQSDPSADPSRIGRGNVGSIVGSDVQAHSKGIKRRAVDAVEDERRELIVFCCQCQMGPFLNATNLNCGNLPNCSHTFCNSCSRKFQVTVD